MNNLKASLFLFLTICLVTLLSISCSSRPKITPTNPGNTDPIFVQSDLERDLSPDVNESDLEELVAGSSEFAFDLYRQLKDAEGNIFFSPYSISACLAMLWAGAKGKTESEMADTLHYTLPQEIFHPTLNALDQMLQAEVGDPGEGDEISGFRLYTANSVWGQDGLEFNPDYLDLLSTNYGAGIRLVDFLGNLEGCRLSINQWVEEQTEDRIKNLIPPGGLNNQTIIVLVNAIYFRAEWKRNFMPYDPHFGDIPFNLLNGETITVKSMKQSTNYRCYGRDGLSVIELPYIDEQASMIILQPGIENFSEFENSLNTETLDNILNHLSMNFVDVTMPMFEYETSCEMSSILNSMGIRNAFRSGADFSGVSDIDFWLDKVFHKAYVLVNESGTEAAAATGGTGVLGGSIPHIYLNSPFIFLIRDNETGAILFMGRVLNPNE